MTTPAPAAPPAPAPAPNTTTRSGPILPLLAIGFGAYLLWFGVKYWKGSGVAVWPSYPLRSVLSGQGVPPNTPAVLPADAQLSMYETQLTAAEVVAGATPAPGTTGPTGTGQAPGSHTASGRGSGSGAAPPAPVNAGGNVGMGKLLAAGFGWTGAQWNALFALWQRESGWSNTARNPSSGAYGIAQALPPTKYPFAGQAAGGSSAKAQIGWGLAYIKDRYGSPEAALAHENAVGWY